jgi:hypothetical protein
MPVFGDLAFAGILGAGVRREYRPCGLRGGVGHVVCGDCGDASSGSQRTIGSSSATSPSSTRSMTAAAVIGFVDRTRSARSSPARSPRTLQISTSSPRATSAAAPGTMPLQTAVSSRSWRSIIVRTDPTHSRTHRSPRPEGARESRWARTGGYCCAGGGVFRSCVVGGSVGAAGRAW